MQKTTNYNLNKIELSDSPPDITVINPNWDTIDSKLKSVENLTTSIKTKVDTIENGAEVNVQSDWNVTATNSDAFIKNKPTSLPANGGNADTVDGKHANEFATAAQGTKADNALPKASYTASDILTKLKTVDGYSSGLDADLLDGRHASSFILKTCTKINSRLEIKDSGLYFMSKAESTDLPISGHDFIMLSMQNNIDINIIAISTSDTNYMYTCSGHSNDSGKTFIYGNWKKSNDNADAQKLKGIVPIKSGGTGADNVIDVLKNLKLKNDSILKEPCSAVLNVGSFRFSASKSMTILEFATAMPLDTSVIFRNAKLESPSISDAPTNYGEILFIKGSTLNYMYALYFDCANNRDIYYWAASSNGIEKNWVKINDGGNADMIDGKHANEFATSQQGTKADNALPKSSYTASDILTKLKTVDGTTSGLDADLLDGYHALKFMLGDGHSYGVSWKSGSSGYALEFRVDVTENLPVRKALEADSLQGKKAVDFSQGFYKKYTFTGSKGNWYRIAKTDFSAAGIFTIKADSPSYNSNTIFAVSSHRSQNISTITKLAHSSFNTLITKIRLVSKYESLTEQFIDIYIGGNISANTRIEFEAYFSGFNWQTVLPVSANIPDGYNTSTIDL